ncbi:putative Ig domain-containing protein [Spirosoma sordidisoli]|uniref:putative Ig domain-containing protein n=1 Tax=Spirosoma sordidisoli TaxID=2502893 RepID=UPI0013E9B282|nr:putative Ig domain-containing protein [Spirosoma sordidisoli]
MTTYSVNFTSNGTVTTDKGTVLGNTITDIPNGETVTLIATLNGCTTTVTAQKDCSCPPLNPPTSGGDQTICASDPLPTLTVSVGAGQAANWYDAEGNPVASDTTAFTPTGPGTFQVETFDRTTGCTSVEKINIRLTVNDTPTLTAIGVEATCDSTGTVINDDAQIILSDFPEGARYQYSEGDTFDVGIPSTPTVIPPGGVIVNNLDNPTMPQAYTVRVYNATNDCYTDEQVTINPSDCTPDCNVEVITSSLPNARVGTAYSQTITATGGTLPYAFTLAAGQLPTGLSLDAATGRIAGTPTATGSFTISLRVTDTNGCSATLPLTVLDVEPNPVCALTMTVSPGLCQTATNTYTLNGSLRILNNTSGGTITVSDGLRSTTLTATSATTSLPFSLTGLPSDGTTHNLVATLSGCASASATYTAPGSCSQPAGTRLVVDKYVSASRAKLGDVLTYTLVLSNVGPTTATNVVVKDSTTTGLSYVAGSASVPTGTSFTPGVPVSYWSVAAISAGQSLSLTLQARVDSSGILYNQTSIPGDTATVCTSVPVKVCVGEVYTFRLTVAPGRASYQWYKDGLVMAGATTNVLDVSSPGSYSLAVDNTAGQCPDFSCCPFIVEEDTLPTFQAVALPATCVGATAQANGQIVLRGFQPAYTYQYSAGASFNPAASLSGAAKGIPASGVIVNTLANPVSSASYTVRVYNGSGCYQDVTVQLSSTACTCPPDVCSPFVIKQTKRGARIGDR